MTKQQLTQPTTQSQPKTKNLKKDTKKNKKNVNRQAKQTPNQIYYEDEDMAMQGSQKKRVSKKSSQKVQYQDDSQQSIEFGGFHTPSCLFNQSTYHSNINKSNEEILFSQFHHEVDEVDFKVYLAKASRSKITSIMLINGHGKILFSDKIGHQLFEGSLNNFNIIKIQQLFLQITKDSFLDQLKNIDAYSDQTLFNWIIYSKNLKRRYSRIPFNKQATGQQHFGQQQESYDDEQNMYDEGWDIYFRFLKSLCIRIRPIRLQIRDPRLIDGFWNHQLIKNKSQFDCFMLESKLDTELPDIPIHFLMRDPILMKFIDSNYKKAEKWLVKAQSQAQQPIHHYYSINEEQEQELPTIKQVEATIPRNNSGKEDKSVFLFENIQIEQC